MNSFPHNDIWLFISNDPQRDRGSFLSTFAMTWLKADEENKTHLYPASLALIHKYGLFEEWRERCSSKVKAL